VLGTNSEQNSLLFHDVPIIAATSLFSNLLSTLIFAAQPTASTIPQKLVSSCRDQLNWRTTYDPTYTKLKFPNGDVPKDKGVCTDVLVRAFRSAGYDLQSLIHKHKSANVN
jgi:uncharacterized protein YijF (DUF1287 family)